MQVKNVFIKSKLKKFTSVFSIVMRMFRKVWNIDCGKKYIFIKLIVAIIDSVVPLIYMIFPGLIVNDLTGEFDVTVLLFHVVILVASPFIYSIISSVLGENHLNIIKILICNIRKSLNFIQFIWTMSY